jgi:hypothetical protein
MDAVRESLARYKSRTAAELNDFESAIARVNVIYDSLPEEGTLHSFREPRPEYYGADIHASFLGMLEEHVSYLHAIRLTCGYKLHELASSISEGIVSQRFRIAVVACRALYEEAAATKYYCYQIGEAIKSLLTTPPTTFRLGRLQRLAKPEFKVLLDRVSLPGKVLKKWYHVRKIDWRKPDVYEKYKLDEREELYPGFFLSAFKTVRWCDGILASYFYAVLCEATHPNSLSNTLYVDDTSETDSVESYWVIRKQPKTMEPYQVTYDYVSVPTIECIRIIDGHMIEMAKALADLTAYIRKVQRVAK